uniref:Uncharacterized protein n=1 Tax=Anopheles culicifacies TaxID=139723 RepID=A0A182M645_9DIPT
MDKSVHSTPKVGYTTNDVLYRWNSGRTAVSIADDMKLSQFDLVEWPAGNVTDRVVHNTASAGATVLMNGMSNADLELGLGLDGGVGRTTTGGEGNGKLYMCNPASGTFKLKVIIFNFRTVI